MVTNTDSIPKIDGHLLTKADRPSDVLPDLSEIIFFTEAEMTTGLAATEGRSFGEEMESRPDLQPLGRAPPRFNLIDAEPEARPRQFAHVGHRLLYQSLELVL